MKQYIKLFEEFITEEDPLADIGGEEKKPKEDPLDAEKKKQQAKEKEEEKKHDKMMDKKEDTIESLLDRNPEVKEKLGDKILQAIKDEDRVKIHNAVLDLIYMQQKYQDAGEESKIVDLTKMKEILDGLDRSFTSSKRI